MLEDARTERSSPIGEGPQGRAGESMADPVTTEWSIPGTSISVRNRTVLAAMTNKQSHEDGTLSDEEISWLLRRAAGGFGIVTTAASHVHPSGSHGKERWESGETTTSQG